MNIQNEIEVIKPYGPHIKEFSKKIDIYYFSTQNTKASYQGKWNKEKVELKAYEYTAWFKHKIKGNNNFKN